jgi:uncharacterized protein YdeI (BOF family)
MKRWLIFLAAAAVMAAGPAAQAGKFKNKDTATDRRDVTIQTRPKKTVIENTGGAGNDTVISVHPEEKKDDTEDYEIGPILIQPQIDK